jgi:hypothetical protein
MKMHEILVSKRAFRIEEFAKRNSISRSQAYIEIRTGRLTARKLGSMTLITVEDETAWLDNLPSMASPPQNAA